MADQKKPTAETLFEAALDLPAEQRAAFLDESCRDNPDLRNIVQDLLSDHERAGSFLSGPVFPAAHDIPGSQASQLASLQAGAKLGRYSILGLLGSGGMGAVYRAQDENLQRAVAIKVLSPGLLASEDARRRFRNEALALARLSHPHIATVYDVGQQDGIDYLVMECVTGESLAARLKSGPLSIENVMSIAMQVAMALEEAHEQGVIHRDLKPANIMITPKGNVKVLDFGIAKLAALETPDAAMTGDAGTLIGTPLYMSPEQVQGRKVDTRTDLWSLGVVVYESLTGRTPFQGDSSFAIMQAIVQQTPPPVRQFRPEIPPAIERITDRLLEKDPVSRFQLAKDAVHDTSDALVRIERPSLHAGVPTSAEITQKLAAVTTQHKKSRRMPWTLLAASVVVAAAAGIGVLILHPKPGTLPLSTPIPLTTYQGSENFPSFSPDGNQVAFEWDGEKQDNLDIYVKALGPDAAPLRLTTDPAADGYPAWSPDGRNIAFERGLTPNRVNLMLIPALGGPERKLTEIAVAGDSRGYAPTWSPDSKWLIVPSLVREHMALFRVSVETGELTQITQSDGGLDDIYAAISPDGKTLLFNRRVTYYNWGTPYSMHLDENALPTDAPRAIPMGGLEETVAAWMPDGKEIIARTRAGVVRLPATGSENPQLVPWLAPDVRTLALSLHGNRLAYAVMRGDANIWRVDLTAKNPVPQRIIASTFRDVYPQFSPDGRRIAFQSMRTGDNNQVWICDADGSHPKQLTFVKKGLAASPHWSPDGQTLEFDSNVTGNYQIYTMSPDGGKITPLTDGHANSYNGNWSRDGRWIYFASQRSGRVEVWKMPSGGGEAVQITHNGGVKALESPDGKTLYFSKEGGNGSIWKMPVEGGPEQQVVDSLRRDNFILGLRGIYYVPASSEDGTSSLKFYSFARGAITTILPIGRPEYGIGLSPDGRYLAYAQIDEPGSDLMLVENFH